MAVDIYSLRGVAKARDVLAKYRGKLEHPIGQAQTVAEIGGASYLAARLSAHLGGPDGKAVLGVPIELAIGAACGALAMSGSAGKHTEDVLAVGVGAIAAYTARLGFQAGLKSAPAPEASAVQGMVGSWPPMPGPPPFPYLCAPCTYAPALPAPVEAKPVAPPPLEVRPVPAEVRGEVEVEVGADRIDSAAHVLDTYNAR